VEPKNQILRPVVAKTVEQVQDVRVPRHRPENEKLPGGFFVLATLPLDGDQLLLATVPGREDVAVTALPDEVELLVPIKPFWR